MATFRLYLDSRYIKDTDRVVSVKLAVSHKSSTSYIDMGVKVLPSQWDREAEKVCNHPNKARFNLYLTNRRLLFENAYFDLMAKNELAGLSAAQIKNRLLATVDPEFEDGGDFIRRFERYTKNQKNENTREKYQNTLSRMRQYDSEVGQLPFEKITKDWLTGFDSFLTDLGNSKNTRNIHFRNIRTVFNDAIDNDVTTAYPFRKFKIRPEQTVKRSLSVEQLKKLWQYNVEPWQQRYLDYFKLTFLLIGINPIDLLNAEHSQMSDDGRLTYRRAKTGRLYDILVLPEAARLIETYKGNSHLVDFIESYKDYKSFVKKLDKGLKTIGTVEEVANPLYKRGGKKHKLHQRRISAFPGLSIYWARHTWATIAAELDIPKETIAAALGHGGNTVTDIYIRFDNKKVDDANRKVVDYVLYGKM